MVENSILQFDDQEVLVVRKRMKHTYVAVLPPDGRIRITTPLKMKDAKILKILTSSRSWILKKQEAVKNKKVEPQVKYKFVDGEAHRFFGEQYTLELIYHNRAPNTFLSLDKRIILQVRPKTRMVKRKAVMLEWYRKELYKVASDLISKWENELGVKTKFLGIKRMKTRWGSCNYRDGRVWLNLELARYSVACVEYVIVHELLHLIERKHNARFKNLLSFHIPAWRNLEEDLKRISYDQI